MLIKAETIRGILQNVYLAHRDKCFYFGRFTAKCSGYGENFRFFYFHGKVNFESLRRKATMRIRNKPWADDFLEENNHIVVQNSFDKKDNWSDVFENKQPIHLEIGSGKGQFIAGMGKQHSNLNFIGIERVKSVIVGALKKVKQAETKNVRLLNENAEDLRELFATNEIDQIYLNFSDPWPKNRHEKRRLTYHTFLQQYKDILKPNGELVMKTDNQHLFEYSLVSFSQFGCVLEEVTLDLHQLEDPLNVKTEYEEKFSSNGQPIYRCRVRFPSTDN